MPLYINPALIHQVAQEDNNVENVSKQSSPSSPLYRIGQAMLVGGNGLDVGSTAAALQNPNLQEGHSGVLGSGMPQIAATKAAVTGLTLLAMHEVSKSHPKLAGLIGIAAGIPPTLAGIHNIKLVNK